jgi:predicted RecA/RadA family phage recombinase
MINYVAPGEVLEYTAPSGGVVSGIAYKIGSVVVIATVDAAEDEKFNGLVVGIVSYTKPGSQAWTEGVKIYWDDSAKKMTSTAGSNTLVGVAAEAVAGGAEDTTGKVRLVGVAR